MIVKNEIMSVLGPNSGYTVKYTPPPSGVPSVGGVFLTVYPSSCPNTDTVNLIQDQGGETYTAGVLGYTV